jgi:hypothetical protein
MFIWEFNKYYKLNNTDAVLIRYGFTISTQNPDPVPIPDPDPG